MFQGSLFEKYKEKVPQNIALDFSLTYNAYIPVILYSVESVYEYSVGQNGQQR